jgi:hypothetical protein
MTIKATPCTLANASSDVPYYSQDADSLCGRVAGARLVGLARSDKSRR